mgnify:CR=1 FL=1
MRLKLVGLLIILSGLSACSTTEKPIKKSDNFSSSANALKNQATNAQSIYQLAVNREGADKIQLLYSARDAAISEKIALISAATKGCFIEQSLSERVKIKHRLKDNSGWIEV